MDSWKIFRGDGREPHEGIERLLQTPEPSWRKFRDRGAKPLDPEEEAKRWEELRQLAKNKIRDVDRGQKFQIGADQEKIVTAINAALYLNRPLLIEGKPGSGKTSLAYAVAYELDLGPVLLWPITTRSTLQEGLYRYDAIARLQDAQLIKKETLHHDIGRYLRLGPAGTAFLPSKYPRVLLIDEVDKSDINLPNDLLNLFEEGEYLIPELERLSKQQDGDRQFVESADEITVTVEKGRVQCHQFPLVVMTSNGERDFPPAFLRRCLQVEMPNPTPEDLTKIVKNHLGEMDSEFESLIRHIINEFVESKSESPDISRSTDQLLNMVYLCAQQADKAELEKLIYASLIRRTSA